jgi:DNA-binding transcriptional regulator YiaG
MTPTPDQIREARQRAGLSQTAAAALIGKPLRTWQNWEAPIGSPGHRKMDAALWEYWNMKAK